MLSALGAQISVEMQAHGVVYAGKPHRAIAVLDISKRNAAEMQETLVDGQVPGRVGGVEFAMSAAIFRVVIGRPAPYGTLREQQNSLVK